MLIAIKKFLEDESGAVTADWVVLTAGIVGLGALMFFYLGEPVQELDGRTGSALAGIEVGEITFD